MDEITNHARSPGDDVLGVISVNLDHLHHISTGALMPSTAAGVRWLNLIDGAPVAGRAAKVVGRPVERLAGSELAWPLLARASDEGLRVGILGGSAQSHDLARKEMERRLPRLIIAGMWSPSRQELDDTISASAIAQDIADARVDILMVCLGKPRQERWIAEWGLTSGARVCLAFGGVVDLMAGRVPRVPARVADLGFEWLWRLAHEPRRLFRRYLVEEPPALLTLQRHAHVPVGLPEFAGAAASRTFVDAKERADVTAFVVTYNSKDAIDALLSGLRRQRGDFTLRVMVCDNGSVDGTAGLVRQHEDVILVEPGENLGYAGGINALKVACGPSGQFLVLNADLEVADDTVQRLRERIKRESRVGCVVPMILESCGRVAQSLRREPSVASAWGDALMGSLLARRPGWLTEWVASPAEYARAHAVDWATGAALLLDGAAYQLAGEWDERFFLYSEETDFMRRIRATGHEVYYEPSALVRHRQGGSGSSESLTALLTVNKVRYFEKWHGPVETGAFRAAMVVGNLLRRSNPGHRLGWEILVGRRSDSELPGKGQMMWSHLP